jgi:hypothetical protein
MIDALGLEISAIRKKGAGSQVEIRGGEFVGQAEGSWIYRFLVADDVYLRDDTPVRITAGQEDVESPDPHQVRKHKHHRCKALRSERESSHSRT